MKGLIDKQSGFTIVELLIVIVVIAILAAIAIVAYNCVQARTNATAIEATVDEYRKGLLQYVTLNGKYPNDENGFCLGEVADYPSGCFNGFTTNSTIVSSLKTTMSTLPKIDSSCKIMYTSSCRRNLTFVYQSGATLNGNPHPYYVMYFMNGAQDCKLSGNAGGTWENYLSTPNVNGYFERDNTTKITMCALPMPNPAKL